MLQDVSVHKMQAAYSTEVVRYVRSEFWLADNWVQTKRVQSVNKALGGFYIVTQRGPTYLMVWFTSFLEGHYRAGDRAIKDTQMDVHNCNLSNLGK